MRSPQRTPTSGIGVNARLDPAREEEAMTKLLAHLICRTLEVGIALGVMGVAATISRAMSF